MCFIDRSLEQVTAVCSLCKAFPPRNGYPCPHKDAMGVCKNRTNHPRHDVLYFRNAELSSFNGCGFCKWAKRNPKLLIGDAAWRNPGSPGCCRPPKPQEYDFIAPTDWYAVSKIHGIPPPTTATAATSPPSPRMPTSKSPNSSPTSKTKSITSSPRTPERRNSGSRDRHHASTSSSSSSSSGGMSAADSRHRSSIDSPRKAESPAARAPVVTRETIVVIPRSPRSTTQSNSPPDRAKEDKERRTSTKTYIQPVVRTPPQPAPQPVHPPRPSNPAPPSSSSSDSSSSLTQSGTVTSEGFTDYLSDESEAEMQREAERRAAEAEIAAMLEKQRLENGREEQEFRAARTQLAVLGLQPPSAWSTGKPIPQGSKHPPESNNPNHYGTAGRSSARSSAEMYRSPPSAQYVPVYAGRQ